MTRSAGRAARSALFGACVLAAGCPTWAKDARAEIDFVTRASTANLAAIAEAQIALDRSGNPDVRRLAQRVLDEHRQAEISLEAAATGSGADPVAGLDPDHQKRVAGLQGKSGADFDKTFWADQAEIHSNALTLYADYMLLGDNAALKALAIKMIPVTEAQFKALQVLPGR